MREELIKQSNKIVEVFVDTLLKTFDDVPKIRTKLVQKDRLYQSLIETKENEISANRIAKKEEKEDYDKKITSLEDAKEDLFLKSKNYEDLSRELKANKKETEDDLAKAKMELIRSQDIRMRAENTMADADKLKKDYNLKLDSLKYDSDKYEKEDIRIKTADKRLKVRENAIFLNETKQNNKAMELNDTESELKVREKEALKMKERYTLAKE